MMSRTKSRSAAAVATHAALARVSRGAFRSGKDVRAGSGADCLFGPPGGEEVGSAVTATTTFGKSG
jgi:hypothetical protein